MMDPNAADRIGQNYQDWVDYFRGKVGGFDPGAFIRGLIPKPPPVTAPEAPAAVPQAVEPPAEVAPPASGEPAKPPSTLEEFQTELRNARTALAAAEALAKDEGQPPDVRTRAAAAAVTLRGGITTILTQIAAEENRIRDEAATKKKEEEAKKKEQDSTPKNGDERWVPIETKDAQGRTVRGIGQEIYTNGVWKYQPGSAKADTGFGAGPQGPGIQSTVLTDGQGNYFTFNPATNQATPLSGPQAAVKTLTGPDGAMYLQKPDGSLGQRLFEGLPQVYTSPDGFMIGVDKRTGAETFRIDTKTKEGRELANRLERATVEQAERAADPKFSSAIAQFQQEATRRQGLAREELARLQELQKLGQLSPEQAEAQFDRWMKLNVEGPLAGFREAAEQERRRQEQENLTRQRAEEARVEGLNRERERLAFEAGEEGRRTGIELGKRTRAPEFIADMGGLAASFSANVGKPGAGASGAAPFQFSPASFDVANYRKAVPNLNELADAAVNRLFSRISPATARDVNVPLPGLPTGPDLQGLMNSVRYTPPGASPGREVAEGQGAVDLKDQGRPGWARTVYKNGEFEDWQIPTTASGQIAQAAAPAPAAPTLPGQLPGETPEQRAARWAAIMAR